VRNTNLGVFAVQDELRDFHIRGGDVCLTHLMEEIKNPRFWLYSKDYHLIDLYDNWTTAGRAMKLALVFTQTRKEELIKERLKKMSFWIEEEQQYYRHDGETFVPDDEMNAMDGDWDPCADCSRCRRRNFLGHRYPEFHCITIRT
jgi:hypothetical protein